MDFLGGLAKLAVGVAVGGAVVASSGRPRYCGSPGGVSFGYGGRHGCGGHGAFHHVGPAHGRRNHHHHGPSSMVALQALFGGAPCRRIYGGYQRPPQRVAMGGGSTTVVYSGAAPPPGVYNYNAPPPQMVGPPPPSSPYYANGGYQQPPPPTGYQPHPLPPGSPQQYAPGGPYGRIVVDQNALVYRGGACPIKPYEFPQPYAQGRCKGLFIGINYYGTPAELRGCVNDVAVILDTLKQLQFPLEEAAILVDDPQFAGASGLPTRENIIQHMLWLVKDAKAGDCLFFHFSGHGSQTKDLDGDEDDGMDETLVPVDFKTAGVIADDDIFELMVRNLPAGVRLTAIMDCCHSASLMDLPFSFVSNGDMNRRHMSAGRGLHMRQSRGDVVMFSGCADDQKSADVSNTSSGFEGNSTYGAGGACTNALSMVLTRTQGLSYMQLLDEMRKVLSSRGFKQMPTLSGSKPIELTQPFSFFGVPTPAREFAYSAGPNQPKMVYPYHGAAAAPPPQPQQQQQHPYQQPPPPQQGGYQQPPSPQQYQYQQPQYQPPSPQVQQQQSGSFGYQLPTYQTQPPPPQTAGYPQPVPQGSYQHPQQHYRSLPTGPPAGSGAPPAAQRHYTYGAL